MSMIEVAPQLRLASQRLEGDTLSRKLALLMCSRLRRYLEECGKEMLELEIKYGLSYEEFSRVEKRHWLGQLKSVEELL